jgi:hypothetical protein
MAFSLSTAMGMPQNGAYENRNLMVQTVRERLIPATREQQI